MKALIFNTPGGTDVLEYRDVPDPILTPGHLLVKTEAIGLNYADLMRRSGVYPLSGEAPYINGYEGAGTVIDANGQIGFSAGDRVCFADVPFANASLVAVPADHAIPLPAGISFETAASVMLQGLTAQFLTADCHQVREGETVLVHAAAGGVGQLLVQVGKLLGAKLICLVSSAEKKEIVQALGADAVFTYNENWVSAVQAHQPEGVDVVYDSVGTTLKDSLAATRVRGQVVLFGLAGGSLDLGNPLLLIAESKTITGGDLWNYLTSREERIRRSAELFGWLGSRQVRPARPHCFQLSEGKAAHDFMESRKSTGKILLIP
ncbi:quinone oxidoreductase [Pedobacter yulinensis]|uniref:Quinone oxidoreductase n=1 Tax=Pedobacter yulinensis TaxID=2126353 RepID=A0A2T3HMZ9_9SPHI|nr:quinone oxidoreductase [Pedobacter yulinensis]PST83809.1 quinone oxidoreductase [Pedobacter yulinensis]